MPPEENEGEQQPVDAPAPSDAPDGHQIRFVARTLDGMEVTSAPISLKAGAGSDVQAKVTLAYWGHGSYLAGQTAYACAAAHGAEGAVVKFIIEKQAGSAWQSVANLRGKVKDERAVVEWPVPSSLAQGSKVRFRAETPWSKKIALEFAVVASGGAGEDPGEGEQAGGGGGKPAPKSSAKPAPAAGKPAPAAKTAPAAKPAPAGKASPRAASGARSPSRK